MNTETRKKSRMYEPTAREIREACRRIRAQWTDRERRRRAGQVADEHWTPPTITGDLLGFDREDRE